MQTQWRGNNGQNMNIMGDFWRYPEVRFRPALAGDEKNPDFSTCTIPYVYYKSHEDNIWHTMISIVPQVIGYLLEGKVNRDITYVVSALRDGPNLQMEYGREDRCLMAQREYRKASGIQRERGFIGPCPSNANSIQ